MRRIAAASGARGTQASLLAWAGTQWRTRLQPGCLGRRLSHTRRINRRGNGPPLATGGRTWRCRRRTIQRIEATGLVQGSASALAARSMAGHELPPLPLAPRERASPEWAETPQAARSRGNPCRAIARDPTEGRGTPILPSILDSLGEVSRKQRGVLRGCSEHGRSGLSCSERRISPFVLLWAV